MNGTEKGKETFVLGMHTPTLPPPLLQWHAPETESAPASVGQHAHFKSFRQPDFFFLGDALHPRAKQPDDGPCAPPGRRRKGGLLNNIKLYS